MIVCKFGGKTTTNINAIKNILTLKKQNDDRVIFVFSAIGKENESDEKLTDVLIKCADSFKKNKNINIYFDEIEKKFNKLLQKTNIKLDIKKQILNIKKKYLKNKDKNYLISRGEYLTSLIMAKYLNVKFVPAEKVIFFNKKQINIIKTYKKLKYYLKKFKKLVIPGFYAIDENKNIKLFSRGGGDITGAIIAKILEFSVYENWTDVVGIRQINPNITPNASQIKKISYKDAFLMTSYDAKVIHKDCTKILKNSKTLIKINSIFNIYAQPTIICNQETKNIYFVVYKKVKGNYVVVIKTNKNKGVIKKYINSATIKKGNIIKIVLSKKDFFNDIIRLYKFYSG